MIRFIVWAHEFVCRVPNVRWPVSAIVTRPRCLEVAHLADEDHVRILTEDRFEARVNELVSAKDLALVTRHCLCGWTNSIGPRSS